MSLIICQSSSYQLIANDLLMQILCIYNYWLFTNHLLICLIIFIRLPILLLSWLIIFRPLNSHGFTYCISHGLTVASSFLTVLQFFSRFFFRLRKQAKAVQFLVKKYRSMVIFVILDIETTTRSSADVSVLGDYQKYYEKYPLSINLASKLLFSWIVFAIIWKFFRTAIKNAYLEWKVCHIDFNNYWIIFFFLRKNHDLTIGFIFLRRYF